MYACGKKLDPDQRSFSHISLSHGKRGNPIYPPRAIINYPAHPLGLVDIMYLCFVVAASTLAVIDYHVMCIEHIIT